MLHGSCLCGGITFEVDADPLFSYHCHCSRCRKASGSAFTSPLVMPLGSVRFTSGEDMITEYAPPNRAYGTRFCRVCGCPVPYLGIEGKIDRVWMGLLDDDPECPPMVHIFVGSKAPWHTIHDDLPQAEERPSEQAQAKARDSMS